MAAQKAPRWRQAELRTLDDVYPREGVRGAGAALPGRTWLAIFNKASERGLRSPLLFDAPRAKLTGPALEEAIRLREVEHWSFARIGAALGLSEGGAQNAVTSALCLRNGFTPAQRDAGGRLTPEGMDRLRWMLRKGMKAVDIQSRLAVSASTVSHVRRVYNAELKARGKALLPPPNGGALYSGAKLAPAMRKEVERLYLAGLGSLKISERTGASKTSIGRIRNRLIKRLARQGKTLPGCTKQGSRNSAAAESALFIPAAALTEFRRLLVEEGMSARRAGLRAGIGSKRAHELRNDIVAELTAEGGTLDTQRLGRGHDSKVAIAEDSLFPTGRMAIMRYRLHAAEHGYPAAIEALRVARARAQREAAEAARRPKTFEEQLAAVRAGARLVNVPIFRRADPTMTLGGVAPEAI